MNRSKMYLYSITSSAHSTFSCSVAKAFRLQKSLTSEKQKTQILDVC